MVDTKVAGKTHSIPYTAPFWLESGVGLVLVDVAGALEAFIACRKCHIRCSVLLVSSCLHMVRKWLET